MHGNQEENAQMTQHKYKKFDLNKKYGRWNKGGVNNKQALKTTKLNGEPFPLPFCQGHGHVNEVKLQQ